MVNRSNKNISFSVQNGVVTQWFLLIWWTKSQSMFAGVEILYQVAQDVSGKNYAVYLENWPYHPMYPQTVVMLSKVRRSNR